MLVQDDLRAKVGRVGRGDRNGSGGSEGAGSRTRQQAADRRIQAGKLGSRAVGLQHNVIDARSGQGVGRGEGDLLPSVRRASSRAGQERGGKRGASRAVKLNVPQVRTASAAYFDNTASEYLGNADVDRGEIAGAGHHRLVQLGGVKADIQRKLLQIDGSGLVIRARNEISIERSSFGACRGSEIRNAIGCPTGHVTLLSLGVKMLAGTSE